MKKYVLVLSFFLLGPTLKAQPDDYFVKFGIGFNQLFEHDSGYYMVGISSYPELKNHFYDYHIKKRDWDSHLLPDSNSYPFRQTYNKFNQPVYFNSSSDLLFATAKFRVHDADTVIYSNFLNLRADGTIRWYEIVDEMIATSIIPTNDGSYFGIVHTDSTDLTIIKLDNRGNKIWAKNLMPLARIPIVDSQILALPDSNYVLRSRSNFFCIDNEANILWQYPFQNEIEQMLIDDDGKILVLSKVSKENRKLTKLNESGELIWEKLITENWNNNEVLLGLNTMGKYLVAWGNSINEYDLSGNFNKTVNISLSEEDEITYINRGSNNDMLISIITNCNNQYVFLRTDSSYYNQDLILSARSETPYIYPINIYLYWNSFNVVNIDLSYSLNNGMTWTYLERNYPSCESYYTGALPISFRGDSVLVRIESSLNPILNREQIVHIPHVPQNPQYDFIAANEIFMWVANNGEGSHDPRTYGSGFYWPGGEDATIPAIFQDGLVYGGKLNGEIRVNGNVYRAGLVPGIVLPDGTPDDPDKPEYRLFKYKKGWENLPEGLERDKYQYNVENWPVELGAPFVDENLSGNYDPEIDTPGNGADEYLFNVSNGADSTASIFFSEPPAPLPLEFHISTFGYDKTDELKDVVFKKYKIINKGNEPLTDFYISYWCDVDMGDASDDVVGSDTTLNLVYTYNGDEYDGYTTSEYTSGYGSPPPSVGHMLMQGPLVKGDDTDRGVFNGKWISGYKNLQMTYSGGLLKNMVPYWDPSNVEEYFYAFQCLDRIGNPIIDPNTNEPVHHMCAGDPVTGTGWYEGDGWPNGPYPGDRRNQIVSGPFEFAAGDTQEVVIAIFMAQGSDRLNSITELRNTARKVNEFFYDELTDVKEEETLPNKIELSQNYPNPFNPSTNIKFSLPNFSHPSPYQGEGMRVRLVVYDILGRQVKTLLNKKLTPGRYEVEFNGINLSSGVYLYKLQVGDTHIVKKMMLLK